LKRREKDGMNLIYVLGAHIFDVVKVIVGFNVK
jgi:hypothetical protein